MRQSQKFAGTHSHVVLGSHSIRSNIKQGRFKVSELKAKKI